MKRRLVELMGAMSLGYGMPTLHDSLKNTYAAHKPGFQFTYALDSSKYSPSDDSVAVALRKHIDRVSEMPKFRAAPEFEQRLLHFVGTILIEPEDCHLI